MAELQSQYSFWFAHLCHMPPREVNRTRLLDFAELILGIDDYLEAKKKANGGD